MTTPLTLDHEQRGILAKVADLLIPAGEAMPSATQAGVPTELIDEALRYRPDLAEDFAEGLRWFTHHDPEAALDDLAAAHPDQFAALSLLIAAAYVLSPQVGSALGISTPPMVVTDDSDAYIDMLAEVVERGFHIR